MNTLITTQKLIVINKKGAKRAFFKEIYTILKIYSASSF